ncbi:MAG: DUF3619 family protein [Rubrivivax sp.]
MNRTTEQHAAVLEALEARLGVRLAAGLSERTAALPHDVTERLRVSREQAVQRLRAAQALRPVAAGAVVAQGNGRSAALGAGNGLWLQLASWVPLAALVAGLLLIQRWTDLEQVRAAAEIDAVLLADDLPPAAWTDPGFREYLRTPNP